MLTTSCQARRPFDFVFVDADKEWYTNYAKAVIPKLAVAGASRRTMCTSGGAGVEAA